MSLDTTIIANFGANATNTASTEMNSDVLHVRSRAEHKKLFMEAVNETLSRQKVIKQGLMTEEKYNEIIYVLKIRSMRTRARSREENQAGYRYSRKFYLLSRNGGDHELFIK